MIPSYEHAGYTTWTMRPKLKKGCIYIPKGKITNSTGTYKLPAIKVDASEVTSISIVRRGGIAYYVLWPNEYDCRMEDGYDHIIEFAWKEGNVWRYVEDADSRAGN